MSHIQLLLTQLLCPLSPHRVSIILQLNWQINTPPVSFQFRFSAYSTNIDSVEMLMIKRYFLRHFSETEVMRIVAVNK